MTKCKLCVWTTPEKAESVAMAELRKHWDRQHPKEHMKVKAQLAAWDNTSRFCSSCGKSQLSAGFINTCLGCLGWYCPDCSNLHTRCGGSGRADRAVEEAA